MADKKVTFVVGDDNEEMFFFGQHEIDKPVMLDIQIGEIIAFSENGSSGKPRIFKKEHVFDIKNMNSAPAPQWLKDLNLS